MQYELSREIPVTEAYDVVVVGGGPGGLGAAVMAARCGAKTLLVERYGQLGGMASVGEVHPFMKNEFRGVPLDRPIYTDWVAAMQALCPAPAESADRQRYIRKDVAALAAEQLCLQAGVALRYHHTFFDTVLTGRHIEALVLHSKSGLSAVAARQFIDCTGDADVACAAGCACEIGNEEGHCQPMTLCFKLANVDPQRAPWREGLTAVYQAAQASGEVTCPRENILSFHWEEPDVVHFNTTRVIGKSAVDGLSLSEAEIEGRRQMLEIMALFRHRVPGYERATLHSMGAHIGVRESRRIRGLARVTLADFLACRKYPDAILRCTYPVDIHNPTGAGTRFHHIPEGDWFELPYGCIVPEDISNLLVGGRPVSVDHAVHASTRVIPPACSLGQAAGCAAALAIQQNRSPAQLDGVAVKTRLNQMGAVL